MCCCTVRDNLLLWCHEFFMCPQTFYENCDNLKQSQLTSLYTLYLRQWQLRCDNLQHVLNAHVWILNFLAFVTLRREVSKLNIKTQKYQKDLLSLKLKRQQNILWLTAGQGSKCHKVIDCLVRLSVQPKSRVMQSISSSINERKGGNEHYLIVLVQVSMCDWY